MTHPDRATTEARLDELKLMVVSQRQHSLLMISLCVIVALCLVGDILQLRVSSQNHRVLVAQIPGLQAQIRARDQTIADQQYELGEAVAAIQKLAAQVKTLGGDPGQIVIKPPKHPTPTS